MELYELVDIADCGVVITDDEFSFVGVTFSVSPVSSSSLREWSAIAVGGDDDRETVDSGAEEDEKFLLLSVLSFTDSSLDEDRVPVVKILSKCSSSDDTGLGALLSTVSAAIPRCFGALW
jgi:hypothetical protein